MRAAVTWGTGAGCSHRVSAHRFARAAQRSHAGRAQPAAVVRSSSRVTAPRADVDTRVNPECIFRYSSANPENQNQIYSQNTAGFIFTGTIHGNTDCYPPGRVHAHRRSAQRLVRHQQHVQRRTRAHVSADPGSRQCSPRYCIRRFSTQHTCHSSGQLINRKVLQLTRHRLH